MNGIVDLSAEGRPLPVRTDRVGTDRTFDIGDLRHRAAGGGDGVKVRIAPVVIRLGDAIRGEVDPRAIRTPGDVALVELAAGELLRLRALVIRQIDRPDVRVARCI